jgi:hypothetical protein
MANRSYLYASDTVPTRDADPSKRRMIGISEWNYDIPVVYKLLSSGNPQACISSIWKIDQKIAIVSEFEAGLGRLTKFLDGLPKQLIQPLREEALQFLSLPANRRKCFVLECGEIFDMQGGNLEDQNSALLQEIQHLNPDAVATEEAITALGLGNWSNILYFDLNDAN